jgi:hypothetical protein
MPMFWLLIFDDVLFWICVLRADWYRDTLQGTRWTERGGSEGAPNQLE